MSDRITIKDKILTWFATGRVGISSKAMACCAAGLGQDPMWSRNNNHPHDPDDFNRCLLLLEAVPEIRNHFGEIARLSEAWGRLIENWEQIETLFLEEAGLNWSKRIPASKTYDLMQEVIYG